MRYTNNYKGLNISGDPTYDTEPEPFRCLECGEILKHEEMSDTPGVCHECDTLEHIQALMRRKKTQFFDVFVNDVFRPMIAEPDLESMLIKKL